MKINEEINIFYNIALIIDGSQKDTPPAQKKEEKIGWVSFKLGLY